MSIGISSNTGPIIGHFQESKWEFFISELFFPTCLTINENKSVIKSTFKRSLELNKKKFLPQENFRGKKILLDLPTPTEYN